MDSACLHPPLPTTVPPPLIARANPWQKQKMPTYDLNAIFSAATPEDRDTCATTFVTAIQAKDLVRARLVGPARRPIIPGARLAHLPNFLSQMDPDFA